MPTEPERQTTARRIRASRRPTAVSVEPPRTRPDPTTPCREPRAGAQREASAQPASDADSTARHPARVVTIEDRPAAAAIGARSPSRSARPPHSVPAAGELGRRNVPPADLAYEAGHAVD